MHPAIEYNCHAGKDGSMSAPLATSTAPLTAASPASRFPLILPVPALLLGLMALLQALTAVWVLQPLRYLPYSGTMHSLALPHVLCGVQLGLAALFAPFFGSSTEVWWHAPLRAVYSALWSGVVLLFGLLVAARVAPLEITAVLASAALV